MFTHVQKCGTVELEEREQEEEVLREGRKAVGCMWHINRRLQGCEAAVGQDGEEGEGVSTEAIKELLEHAPMAGVV